MYARTRTLARALLCAALCLGLLAAPGPALAATITVPGSFSHGVHANSSDDFLLPNISSELIVSSPAILSGTVTMTAPATQLKVESGATVSGAISANPGSINNNGTISGDVILGAGAFLRGSGTVTGNVTVGAGASIDPSVTITGAVYYVGGYTITLDANGGTGVPATLTRGQDTTNSGGATLRFTLPTPTRSGYTFEGWEDSGGTRYRGTYTATGDETLTAIWQPATDALSDIFVPIAQEAVVSQAVVVNVAEWVNVRSGPGTDYDIIGKAYLGEALQVLQTRDGWVECYYNNGSARGWIHGEFVGYR